MEKKLSAADFLKKLNEVVDELKSNPDVKVLLYNVAPPNLDEIKEVEEILGFKLDSSISDFYKVCGGVQLIWSKLDNEDLETNEEFLAENPIEETNIDAWYLKGGSIYPDGSIWIPSIKSVFTEDIKGSILNTDYINETLEIYSQSGAFKEVDEENYSVFELDWCSASSDFVFMMPIKECPNPLIILGDDNGATFDEAHPIYFSDYLNVLIKSKGSVEKRANFLNKNSNGDIEEGSIVKSSDIESYNWE